MEWIKYSERLPEVGKWVIGYQSDPGDVRIFLMYGNGMWHKFGNEYAFTNDAITHWQPLPDPPSLES